MEMDGSERIWINSPRDWGCSDPLAISQARLELQWPGHSLRLID